MAVKTPGGVMQPRMAEMAAEPAPPPHGVESSPTSTGTTTSGTATPATAPPAFTTVEVFYGTDRSADDISSAGWSDYLSHFYLTAAIFGATLLMAYFARLRYIRGLSRSLAYLGAASTFVLGLMAALDCAKLQQSAQRGGVHYGNGRGELALGACQVTIPATHQVGELEAPSILRFEVHEDETKHIVLHSAQALPEETFFKQLQDRVAASPKRDAFVFIHGFNVSFEDAARRTAQMAHDLRYAGAPVFYSWPSQAGLLKYTIDETNAEWTVPHLERFLQEVAAQSGAESISLIAHSMGNRAMTRALQRLRASRAIARCFVKWCSRRPTSTQTCSSAKSRRRSSAPPIA